MTTFAWSALTSDASSRATRRPDVPVQLPTKFEMVLNLTPRRGGRRKPRLRAALGKVAAGGIAAGIIERGFEAK